MGSCEDKKLPDVSVDTLNVEGKVFSALDAMRLIYCLMAVDGVVRPEEKEQLREIGNSLDPDFKKYLTQMAAEEAFIKNAECMPEEDYYASMENHVTELISQAQNAEEGINARTLIWDLMVMAISEGDYAPNEKKLIWFISGKLGIDAPDLEYMEQAMRTLLTVNREIKQLEAEALPDIDIKERIIKLNERKDSIMGEVYDLLNE